MNQEKFIDLYNDRYKKGYMEDWPQWKINRVSQILGELELPQKGVALDFGCENGFWTNVLKQLLPDWKVYGVDVSQIAISHSKERVPECEFVLPSELKEKKIVFDLVFSHHVLEHVVQIESVVEEISNLLKDKAYTFHILPCGNKGSFEDKLCSIIKEGIREDRPGTYFYEDPTHLRRMSSNEINSMFVSNGLRIDKNYFARQYYGAIDWLTGHGPNFVLFVCNLRKSKDLICFLRLLVIRFYLVSIAVVRFMKLPLDPNHNKRKIKKYLYHFAMMFYPFSSLVNEHWSLKRDKEWSVAKDKQNGSEMYVVYRKIW